MDKNQPCCGRTRVCDVLKEAFSCFKISKPFKVQQNSVHPTFSSARAFQGRFSLHNFLSFQKGHQQDRDTTLVCTVGRHGLESVGRMGWHDGGMLGGFFVGFG